MILVAVKTHEYKRERIGQENVDSFPLGRTAMADPMDPNPSLAEESLTKKCYTQSIGCKIAEAVTVSLPSVLYTLF